MGRYTTPSMEDVATAATQPAHHCSPSAGHWASASTRTRPTSEPLSGHDRMHPQRRLGDVCTACRRYNGGGSSPHRAAFHERRYTHPVADQRRRSLVAEQLLPLVYDELRKLAAARMAQEKPGQTLQATALVHEAYIRLVDVEKAQHWNSRGHFFAAAAEAMRRILVENARRKQAERRGGGRFRVALSDVDPAIVPPSDDLLAFNEALEKLEKLDTRKAEVVKLRLFTGLTVPQVAELIGLSASTVDNYWAYARAWLLRRGGHDCRNAQ